MIGAGIARSFVARERHPPGTGDCGMMRGESSRPWFGRKAAPGDVTEDVNAHDP